MKVEEIIKSLPDTEKKLLEKYDEIAKEKYDLSFKIDDLSKLISDNFAVVLKQRGKEYVPLDEDIIEKSSENDILINKFYELSSIMIAIENKLRKITKES